MSEPVLSRPLSVVPALDAIRADPSLLDRLGLDVLLDLQRQHGHLGVDLSAAIARKVTPAHAEPALDADVSILTTKRLAALWGMTEAKIRDLCRTGRLPAAKLGAKEWVVSVAGLRDLLPKTSLATSASEALLLTRDTGRTPEITPSARPFTVEIRRPAGRAHGDGREVGGGNAGHEQHK